MAFESQLVKFYSTATQLGFARDNLFRLTQIQGAKLPDSSLVYLKSASVPSRTIRTGKMYYKNFALNVPFGMSYPESANWKVSFYSDKDYLIRNALEEFSRATYNETDFTRSINTFNTIEFELCKQTGLDKIEVKGNSFAINSLETALVDHRNMEEKIDSVALKPVIKYKLYGCFPVNIGSINYNTTSTGALITVDATIAYQYVESDYVK